MLPTMKEFMEQQRKAMFILSFEADTRYYDRLAMNVKEEVLKILLRKEKEFNMKKLDSYTTSTIVFEVEMDNPFESVLTFLADAFDDFFEKYPFYFTFGEIAYVYSEKQYKFNAERGDHEQSKNFQEQIKKVRADLKTP